MAKTVEELCHQILLRLYFGKSNGRFEQRFLRGKVSFICNQILSEDGEMEICSHLRGQKIFIFYKPTNRIVCEIVAEGDETSDVNYIDNPTVYLTNLKGRIDGTVALSKLISDVKKLGERKKWNQK